ncbi:MaoC family dehydratase [Pseudomaricurvus alkylphenolicus]|jgi:acyl dehydratase|uniref:MaoC family dehydratase n=1 Tax=Pseudomaricurvus alkylphenolicus TaxID=1306991 RepID=UPI0014214EFD|nr:MaoC family dehydratase [Pseudomaricurvus alkylphenolicus]NIB38620.1 MaoC family dehydratase [Pseudomaricurvus alkylphenolicus]
MFFEQKLYFENLQEGKKFELGSVTVSKEDIFEFAERYDPQAFHLDEATSVAVFGGLAASGWQTACLFQRLMARQFLNNVVCLGGAGVENLQFAKPVFADDKLSGRVTIAERRLSKSRPDRGLVKLLCEMVNTQGDLVLSMIGIVVIATNRTEARMNKEDQCCSN